MLALRSCHVTPRALVILLVASCVDGPGPTGITQVDGVSAARNPASLPDLAFVGQLATDRSDVFPGEQVTLSAWSISNAGRAAATHWSASIVLARDTALSQGVAVTVPRDVPIALPAPGDPVAIPSFALLLPATLAPGTYFLGGIVDAEGRVAEQDETNNFQSVRIHVAPDIDARNAVAAGERFSCGLNEFGQAFCWGLNDVGQLGNGSMTNSAVPVAVSGDHRFVQISAEGGIACAVSADADAYCWGRNTNGQLGDGTQTSSAVPVQVSGNITFAQVSTGNGYACGLSTSGTAHCWGQRLLGRLGDGSSVGVSTTPVAVAGNHLFKSISVGLFSACAVDINDDGWCWGQNSLLGLGTTTVGTFSDVPVMVQGGHKWSDLQMGVGACGISVGVTYCWGINRFGERGNGQISGQPSAVPSVVIGNHLFTSVAPATGNIVFKPTCALTVAQDAYCWGANNLGQLGSTVGMSTCLFGNFPPFQCTGTPTLVTGGNSYVAIRAGEEQVCAITTTRQFACWGRGLEGQLGNGALASSSTPVFVTGLQSP